MSSVDLRERLIVALDVNQTHHIERLVKDLAPYVGCFKVGLEIITAVGGPSITDYVHGLGGKLFYDGKFKDIPEIVKKASKETTLFNCGDKKVEMFNVHCMGGMKMMRNAMEGVEIAVQEAHDRGIGVCHRPLVLGVTILTSLDFDDLCELGIVRGLDCLSIGDKEVFLQRIVVNLALKAKEAGLDGVISSPQEIVPIREKCGSDFRIITPGVRPEWYPSNDQKRVMTPAEAIKAGATALVVGRPIVQPPKEIGSPIEAAKRVLDEISSAL